MALAPGERPTCTLLDQSGQKVNVGDLEGRKVLVYFYPGA